ncbi:MAG: hypothetical protein ACM65M_03575 [Microcoleus sp.]
MTESIIATRDGKVGTVDATSGSFSQIATSNLDFSDIALSNSGQLFGITFDNLYKIDPNLGSASLIGNFGLGSSVGLNALEFANNTLYAAADGANLYTINVNTGAANLAANLGSEFDSSGDLVFDAANNRFFATSTGTTSDSLFSVSLTGQATKIGNIGFTNVFGVSFENGNLIGFTEDRKRITINSTTGTGTFDKNLTGISGSIGGASSIPSATPTPTPPTPTPPTVVTPTPTPPTVVTPTPTPPTVVTPTPTPPTVVTPTPTPPTVVTPTPTPPTVVTPPPLTIPIPIQTSTVPPSQIPKPDSSGEVDLNPLKLKVINGQFTYNEKTKRYEASGTIQIGRKDGKFPLINVPQGTVKYDQNKITVDGTVFSSIGNVAAPLFKGKFDLDVKTATGSIDEESGSLPNEFKIGGLDIDFKSLSLNSDALALGSDLKLSNDLGNIQLPLSVDGLIIDKKGPKLNSSFNFSSNKIIDNRSPDKNSKTKEIKGFQKFNLLGYVGVKEISDVSLEYLAPEDSLKLRGKFTFDVPKTFGKDSEVVADLSGENFLQYKNGKLDVNGAFTIKRDVKLDKVAALKDLKLTWNSITREFGAGATIKFPDTPGKKDGLEIGGDIGITYNPWDLKSLSGKVDNLNKPIAGTPFYLQGGSVKLDNINPFRRFSGEPNLSNIKLSAAEFKSTFGAQLSESVKIPLPDWAGGDQEFSSLGEFKGGIIIDFWDSITAKGEAKFFKDTIAGGNLDITANLKDSSLSIKGGISGFNGLFSIDGSFKITPKGFTITGEPKLKYPKVLRLPFMKDEGDDKKNEKGDKTISSSLVIDFTDDKNFSNDYARVTSTFKFEKIAPFLPDISLTIGAEISFDGKVKILTKEAPKTSSSIAASSLTERVAFSNQLEASADKTASAIKGFTVTPGTPWIILNANWDNASSNTPVEIKAPNGAIFKESDFAANKIAVVDALTSTTTKAVVIANPQPGNWDINLTNSAALGTVEYSAFEDSQAPTVQVTTPSKDVSGQNVTINYNAFDADSTAKVSLFYDTDNKGFDGILIKGGLEEKDGAGNFVWNTQGIPTGDYYVYAMAMDENNAPVFSYSPLPIKVTESADLSVTKTADRDTAIPGSNVTYTVAVTNNGTDNAKGAILTETLPEGAKFVSANIAPTKQSGNELTFDLGDVPKGQISTVSITVTAPTTGNITGTSSITSKTYDPDISNDFDFASTTVTNDGTESATDNILPTPTPTPPRPPLRQVLGTPENDNLVGIDAADSIAGFAGDDTLAGLGGDDIIYGNKGNDIITGDSGNDNIFGGRGNDLILGGADNDRLKGNEGDDTLSGDLGRDILIGGPGSDTFVLPKNAAVTGDFLPDAILDFQLGADKIGLTEGLTQANLLLNFELGNTVIKIAGSNQTLGVVVGVTPSQLSGSFVSINLPLI